MTPATVIEHGRAFASPPAGAPTRPLDTPTLPLDTPTLPLDTPTLPPPSPAAPHAPHAPHAPADGLAARRAFRSQIARLERELATTLTLTVTDTVVQPDRQRPRHRAGTAHLLSLGELETTRDALLVKLDGARTAAATRSATQERARQQLERMLADPPRHKFVRVWSSDLGEPGCGAWEVRPRLGLIGMLAGWWEVKLSSGCPLPGQSPAGPSTSRSSARALPAAARPACLLRPAPAWR